MINGHGNNLYEYGNQIRYDFSSNVAFNNKSDEILDFLKEKIVYIKNYPDPEAKILTRKIAEHYGINPQCILVTNGSAEAFYLLAHFFQGAKTLICTPAFAEYEDACKLYRHNCHFVPIEQFKNTNFSSYQSVWLGNPNNPDGTLTQSEDILRQCQKNPETFFILDNAYIELTYRKDEIIICGQQPKNLIIVKSLTKSFAIPGIRLGYVIASQDVIAHLSSIRPPWSVNSMALDAGTYIIDNYNHLLPDVQMLREESLFLQKELSKNKFIEVYPSSCNFFLSRLKKGTAGWFTDVLIKKYGLLIRDTSNFRGIDDKHFRLSAQNHVVNKELINAINNILSEF